MAVAMRTPTVFHPQYFTHVRPSVEGTQVARARVFRPAVDRPTWVEGQGLEVNNDVQIWEGPARVQPNIDWRARTREFQGEYDATEPVRIQLPMHRNEYLATLDADGKIETYALDPVFAFGDIVEVIDVNAQGQRTLLHKRYTVRNALPSTNMWVHDLLTDVGTSLHG